LQGQKKQEGGVGTGAIYGGTKRDKYKRKKKGGTWEGKEKSNLGLPPIFQVMGVGFRWGEHPLFSTGIEEKWGVHGAGKERGR